MEDKTVKAMKQLYDNSNHGMSIDYFEGKEKPTEFKTKYQLKQMAEESGEEQPKKVGKVKQAVGKLLGGLKGKENKSGEEETSNGNIAQVQPTDDAQTVDAQSNPQQDMVEPNVGEVVEPQDKQD